MRSYLEHARAISALLAPLKERLIDPARAETVVVHRSSDTRSSHAANHAEPPHQHSSGRVLAIDVVSPGPLPAFTNSQMDGYAVLTADLADATSDNPVRLRVGATTAAGDPPASHIPETASPIMTGAVMPLGADAVVPVEQASPPAFPGIGAGQHDANPNVYVAFTQPPTPGDFVREVGSDILAGATLARAGTRISPALAGALSAAGITEVRVCPRIKILFCATGHELVPPGEALSPGKLFDANSTLLCSALRECGTEVVERLVPDDASALVSAIQQTEADLVVTTGGVSAGAFEVVRDALEPAGVEFTRVAIQPGGPQGLGMAQLGQLTRVPVIAFPGNPVSAAVSFELFLRPWLLELSGRRPERAREKRRLAHEITSPISRHQVRRGTISEDGRVVVSGPGSHLLHDYALADVLAHIPVGVSSLPAGAEIEVWRIDD